jgi:ribosomal-protein-alanine N-acetyltransferase
VRFSIRPLTELDVEAMLGWHYAAPYDAYDWDADPGSDEDLRAGVGTDRWYAVDDADTGELAGFLEITPGEEGVELGLGLHPDLTGQGLGRDLVEEALGFVRDRWSARPIWLDVLPWNERAIRVYEGVGFVRGEVYRRRFPDGGENTFLRMTLPSVG